MCKNDLWSYTYTQGNIKGENKNRRPHMCEIEAKIIKKEDTYNSKNNKK